MALFINIYLNRYLNRRSYTSPNITNNQPTPPIPAQTRRTRRRRGSAGTGERCRRSCAAREVEGSPSAAPPCSRWWPRRAAGRPVGCSSSCMRMGRIYSSCMSCRARLILLGGLAGNVLGLIFGGCGFSWFHGFWSPWKESPREKYQLFLYFIFYPRYPLRYIGIKSWFSIDDLHISLPVGISSSSPPSSPSANNRSRHIFLRSWWRSNKPWRF